MPIPTSWSKKKQKEHEFKRHTNKPDVDNLAKLVMDALNGVAYADDKQIYSLSVSKIYSPVAGTSVTIFVRDEVEYGQD